MALYLMHWSPPLEGGRQPKHYLGWSTDDRVEQRIANHMACGPKAARIVVAAVAAGRDVRVAWVRRGDRTDEARLKRRKEGFTHLCPLCRSEAAPQLDVEPCPLLPHMDHDCSLLVTEAEARA